jgi:aromatic ring-cleaving dioxygenase
MKTIDSILLYHAHLYYGPHNIEEAKGLADAAAKLFGVDVGHFHQRPVGPHPAWSCQLTVQVDQFSKVIPWLSLNRGAIDVFIHPETGDDLSDHTQFIMWLGKSYDLNLGMFER